MKPGWQTSEWWISILATIISGLLLLRIVNQSDATTLQEASARIIEAVFVVATNAWIIVTYIKGRVTIKTMDYKAPNDQSF